MLKLRVALLCLTGIVALGAGVALGQYPQPGGNVTATPSNPNPAVGATVQLTVTATTATGAVDPNVSCTAAISSQPGTGASVSPTTFTTGSNGQAVLTIQTGSASGQLGLSVVCGARTTAITLPVGAPPAAPATGMGTEPRSLQGWDSGMRTMALAGLAMVLTLVGVWKFARRAAR